MGVCEVCPVMCGLDLRMVFSEELSEFGEVVVVVDGEFLVGDVPGDGPGCHG